MKLLILGCFVLLTSNYEGRNENQMLYALLNRVLPESKQL